ncbi:MAG TPA: NfeD family protein [Bacteroidetes bacterium]|nr:NfeD family protein [Bacteroidota bacterium]HEX05274.1 NfeD family protein [Bacteroidota bacterium]
MVWWIWGVVGLVLLIGELLTPGGFYIFFFGVGAMLTMLLGLFGLELPLVAELFIFLVSSIVFLFIFRKPIIKKLEGSNPKEEIDAVVGEYVTASSVIAPSASSQVEYRGVPWKVKNIGSEQIEVGDECIVKQVTGLSLDIEKQNI